MGQKTGQLHARDHKPQGQDPIDFFIAFEFDNVGGWLHIETTGDDGDGLGVKWINSGADFFVFPSGVDQDQSREFKIFGDGGSQLAMYSGGDVDYRSGSDSLLEMSSNVDLLAGDVGGIGGAGVRYARLSAGTGDEAGVAILDGRDADGETASIWVGNGFTALDGVHTPYDLNGIVEWLRIPEQTLAVLGYTIIPVLEITGDYEVDWIVNRMTIFLANGAQLEVQDDTGNPIFRIDNDGDLHGLTGKALTFDL